MSSSARAAPRCRQDLWHKYSHMHVYGAVDGTYDWHRHACMYINIVIYMYMGLPTGLTIGTGMHACIRYMHNVEGLDMHACIRYMHNVEGLDGVKGRGEGGEWV